MNAGRNKIVYDGTYGDSTQLIFLRARWYNPANGRFQSRDTWEGNVNRPMSMNRWGYVEGNPLRFIDPTGHYNREAAVSYAYKHDRDLSLLDVTGLPGFQCTNFASSVLWAGGIRDPRPDPRDPINAEHYKDPANLKYDDDDDVSVQGLQPPYWNEDIMKDSPFGNYWFLFLQEWYVTDQLVDFLGKNSLADFKSYPGVVPQFNVAKSTSENVNRNNTQWKEWLRANKASIMPGDLVFYKWSSGNSWDHVAVVTDWSVQTYMDETGNDTDENNRSWGMIAGLLYYHEIAQFDCGFDWDMIKPRVVEQSGSIQYPADRNRSVDNTAGQVGSIMFAHIR
jgi:RHS repeat-associated protein